MVARSGMFVAPLAGTPPVGMSPTDGRIAFSALIGTTPQPASGAAITQSASIMAITVAPGVFQLPDVSNATGTSTFLSAVDLFTVTPAAGPATGSRIDLIVVKQNNVENSDADSRVNVVLVAGTAGAPGVAPPVPTGAYLYATVNVPAVVTNSAACTVVIARPSTFGPLLLTSPTIALLSTFAGVVNQKAFCPADGITYRYNGTTWKPWDSDWINWTPALSAGAGSFVTGNGTLTARYQWVAGQVSYLFRYLMGTTSTIGTNSNFTLPITADPNISAYAIQGRGTLGVTNGSQVVEGVVYRNGTSQTSVVIATWNVAGTYTAIAGITAAIPFGWGAGCYIELAGTYAAA